MAADLGPWLKAADDDLKTVRNCLYGPEPTFTAAAYHCQQAAEKLTKAALVSAGIDPPRWHHIGLLVDLLPQDHLARAYLAALDDLTQYATAFRYPGLDEAALPSIPEPLQIEDWLNQLGTVRLLLA